MFQHHNAEYQVMIDHLESCAQCRDERDALTNAIQQLEIRSKKDQDQIGLAICQYHKTNLLYVDAKFDELKACVTTALSMCKEIKLDFYTIRCYNMMAIADSETADYYSSFSNYLKAYYMTEKHPEYKYGAILLNNIGDLFVWLNEHEIALEYLLPAFDQFQKDYRDTTSVIYERSYNMIIINIIEEYSILSLYDKLEPWLDKITNPSYLNIVKMITHVNNIDQCYQGGDTAIVPALIQEVLSLSDPSHEFIYNFRICLRLFTLCIDHQDANASKVVLAELERMCKHRDIDIFRYNYTFQKYRYYEHFIYETEADYYAKPLLKNYVEESQKKILQFQKTYTRRLIAEKELQNAQFKQKVAEKRSRQLERDLERDAFTGILNKHSMEKGINDIQQKPDHIGITALLLIDIDYFKQVNDTYGHKRGDEIILEVVEMISFCCTKQMLFGRFGGDEFLLFIHNVVQLDFITALAKELNQKAHAIMLEDDQHISLSIGIHILGDQERWDTAFEKADKALYITKGKGRDGYTIYKE